MFARFKDQVDFYAVYIREAHPTDGWQMSDNDRAGIKLEQPQTIEQRNLVATRCCTSLGLTMPLLVDTIDERALAPLREAKVSAKNFAASSITSYSVLRRCS